MSGGRPSALRQFSRQLESHNNQTFANYIELHRWCCEHPESFWSALVTFADIPHSGDLQPVLSGAGFLQRRFFPAVSINYASCVLDGVAESAADDIAVTVIDEAGDAVSINRADLTAQSMSVAAFLKANGVVAGDRVVAIARNSIESIAACLGCAAIGATWSSVAPELGTRAVVERFGQLEPRLLFANTCYQLNGSRRAVDETVAGLLEKVPSIAAVALLSESDVFDRIDCDIYSWSSVMSHTPVDFNSLEQFPFDHPLFVMFSSGTTGVPKCIVHGAGGTLLEHIKEHRLHSDLTRSDILMFQTSTGWMMWNWQLSALASGTHIVLYDGSVSYPDKTSLLRLINDHQVTVFGTSPAYIQFLIESGITPNLSFEFEALRAIQTTGSILFESQFEWIGKSFKNVPVQSVSGGTDMIGCLVLGHPELPVITGDSQCISLGIDVRVKSAERDDISYTGSGELVVVRPFPSQPVFFWGDHDNERLGASYFEQNPDVWTHGDLIRISSSGSPRILGRSDGTLNVRGVRIGPAEILSIVNQFDGVRESMVIEQASPREPGGSRLVLLLVMQDDAPLERTDVLQLKKKLATEASRLHVPSVIVSVSDLPRTHNGKLSEKAARDVVNDHEVTNATALSNLAVLDEIRLAVPPVP